MSGRNPILIILAVILLSSLVYGFAAANTVPEIGAGEGSGTVSGYTISNVDWTLLSSSPNKLSSISFDVAPTGSAGAAGDVRISIDGGTNWITCTGSTGSTWACSFGSGSEPSVSAINSLQVVAVE